MAVKNQTSRSYTTVSEGGNKHNLHRTNNGIKRGVSWGLYSNVRLCHTNCPQKYEYFTPQINHILLSYNTKKVDITFRNANLRSYTTGRKVDILTTPDGCTCVLSLLYTFHYSDRTFINKRLFLYI